jgi:hypothetical protein
MTITNECETASTSAPGHCALRDAQGLRIEDPRDIPDKHIQGTTYDVSGLFARAPASPDPPGDHFVHQSLQLNAASIRLVEVLTPHADGTIRCLIKHTQIGRSPKTTKYTCLSYTWGSPDATRWILMNGKPMKVGCNLWEFLRAASAMRAKVENAASSFKICFANKNRYRWYRNLWIDALCINQAHDQEKNHQVQLMGRIYKDALGVVVWLGNDANVATLFKWDLKENPESMREVLYQNLDQLAYWHRAWLVQEMLLARHVYFLSQETMITLSELRRMTANLATSSRKLELAELLNLATMYSSNLREPSSLIQNLEHYRHKECKDLRDRIYSALSISCNGKNLSVNYDCSFLELARSTLLAKKAGACLSGLLTVLQVLQLESHVSNQEKCSLLVSLPRSKSLEHIAPCAHCCERSSTFPEDILLPTMKEVRYICLRCNHQKTLAYVGVHTSSHKGHLCLIRCIKSDVGSHGWQLFWTACGGVVWRKLEGHISISTTEDGAFQRLSLSVGLICELMHLIDLRENEDIGYEHAHIRNKPYSVYRARWEAVR